MEKFINKVYELSEKVGLFVESFRTDAEHTTITIEDNSSVYYEDWCSTFIRLHDIEDRKEWLTALREEIKNEVKDSINFPQSFINKLEDLATEIEKTIN